MINPGDEFVKRNSQYNKQIADLTFEYYSLNERSKEIAKRMNEIDLIVANLLGASRNNEKAAKDFDTYLAIKEGAVTLKDIENGVKEAGKIKENK